MWDRSGAVSPLREFLIDDGFSRGATASSYDGVFITGTIRERFSQTLETTEAFRWTAEEGIIPLGMLPGGTRSFGDDISGDGSVIVGSGNTSSGASEAFRWTADDGVVSLGTLPTTISTPSSHATGVSAAGDIIVGTSSSIESNEAFRWTAETGLVGLGALPGGRGSSGAEGISADGSTIVGQSDSLLAPNNGEAFRWTEETGMQGLGFLTPNDFSTAAQFVSAEGRVVFGFVFSLVDGDIEAGYFVWDPVNGMRDFVEVLEDEVGLASELAGWTEIRPRDISDDGLSLVGSGTNPEGDTQGWLITLDRPLGVPEPSTTALLGVALTVGVHRQRNRR